jgi:sugar lactone lactonase YvrE
VTKAVFGGERADLLYVTSARYGVDDETLTRYPDTGGVLEIAGIGSAG